MANEIYLNYTFNVQNPTNPASGQLPFVRKLTNTLQLTQNGVGESAGVMNVPTTAGGTALPVGGVTTNGYAVLTNLDTTNYVQVGIVVTATFRPMLRIKPGESQVVRFDQTATIYLLANTAPVAVEFNLFQD